MGNSRELWRKGGCTVDNYGELWEFWGIKLNYRLWELWVTMGKGCVNYGESWRTM